MTQELELDEDELIHFPKVKHRVFTYQEKKFNRMNREELLNYVFISKPDRELLRYWINEKYDILTGDRKLKQVQIGLEMEHRKKITPKHHELIESIFDIKEIFENITLLEAIAITQNALKYQSEHRKSTRSKDKKVEDSYLYSLKLHEDNWPLSMEILKKKRK